jgi:glycosyltransferase involved in cell wall biosynthesis
MIGPTYRPKKGITEKLQWTLDPRSDYPYGIGIDPDVADGLQRVFQQYDLIWFFRLRAAEVFPNAIWPRSVVDIDDLPTTYEQAALLAAKGPRESFKISRRLFAWKRRERLLGDRFTVLSVCSEEDRQYLCQFSPKASVHVIPNGFTTPARKPKRCLAVPPRIGFIGLFDFLPNRDGISWFIDNCWPSIKSRVPQVKLRLIGEDKGGWLNYFGPDVDRLGWLANTSDEMKTWSAMVVPIRIGAGTRIKIAHGFSEGCPVVSTTFGAYGYGAVDGREIYLADSPSDFANACIRAICDPESASRVSETAWRMFLKQWTWDSIRPRVWLATEECLRKSNIFVGA